MFNKLKYIYSKILVKVQVASIRDSLIDKTAKIGARSNIINIKMGKYSYMGNNCSVSNVDIGNYCSIASYCSIGGGDHPTGWVSTSPIFYTKSSSLKVNYSANKFIENEKVIIGNDVWIGEKCFIKPGIKIGDGAIIGAHSVVTKDIPNYSIVAGVPAKIIKYRFNENVVNNLMRIKWWNFNEDELKKYSYLFNSPEKFIKKYNEDIRS